MDNKDNKNIKKQQGSMAEGQMETPKSATQASEYANANKAPVSKENARGAMAGEEGRENERNMTSGGEHDRNAGSRAGQTGRTYEERSASQGSANKGGNHGSR
jgi:hypothetical protein